MLDSPQSGKTASPTATVRRLLACALVCLLPALGACNAKKIEFGNTTEAIARGMPELPRDEAARRQFAEEWGRRYDANPQDKATAMTCARAPRARSRTPRPSP